MAFLNTDIPELWGSDSATCLANLDILAARQSRLWESMLAMLSELADAIVTDAGGDPDTVYSILLSLRGTSADADPTTPMPTMEDSTEHILSGVASINQAPLSRLTAPLGTVARMTLYRFIEERLPSPTSFASSPLPGTARGRIAYMPGAFADKAYLRLAAAIPGARAATFHSFIDACEEVRGGLCEYCILPLENTASGRLTAFSRLVLRYHLCAVAVCDLENGVAEGQITRFALLCRTPEGTLSDPLIPLPTDRESPHYLELLHAVSDPTLGELLSAAAFCGLSLVRADTLPPIQELEPLADTDGAPLVACVFETTHADLPTFRRYLALEAPEDILMGCFCLV